MSTEMQGRHQVQSINTSPSVGGKYQTLIDANPYRNIEYTKTPWQNFLTSLGFRTQADAWKENMQVQANEYDAAIMQKQYDEHYNDPQSQVQRMRAAGLNPDIDGGSSIDSGSAAPPGEDPSTPMQTTADDASQLLSFGQSVMSAVTSAIGMASGIQGLQRNRLQYT